MRSAKGREVSRVFLKYWWGRYVDDEDRETLYDLYSVGVIEFRHKKKGLYARPSEAGKGFRPSIYRMIRNDIRYRSFY